MPLVYQSHNERDVCTLLYTFMHQHTVLPDYLLSSYTRESSTKTILTYVLASHNRVFSQFLLSNGGLSSDSMIEGRTISASRAIEGAVRLFGVGTYDRWLSDIREWIESQTSILQINGECVLRSMLSILYDDPGRYIRVWCDIRIERSEEPDVAPPFIGSLQSSPRHVSMPIGRVSSSPVAREEDRAAWAAEQQAALRPRSSRELFTSLVENRESGIQSENSRGDSLRQRSSEEGEETRNRNLNLQYSGCFVKYKGEIVLIESFEGEARISAVLHVFNKSNGLPASQKKVLFKESEFDLTFPELGWVNTPEGIMYLSVVIGGYQKSLSSKNSRIDRVLSSNPDVRAETTRLNANLNVLDPVFNKRYISLEKGISENIPRFIVNQHLAINSVEEKKMVYFGSDEVGELYKKHIKLKKKYSLVAPYLSRALQYDVR